MFSAPAYWDTSALLRAYVDEPGSASARNWVEQFSIISSRILAVELAGALRRRREDGTLSAQAWSAARNRVAQDQSSWLLMDVDVAALGHAESIAEHQRVRALDAIHLGTAVLAVSGWPEPLPFLTADRRQYEAALALGLAARLLS